MTSAGKPGRGGVAVRVFPTLPTCIDGAAEYLAREIRAAIADRGRCCIALSGGSTPRPVYELLGSSAFSGEIDWSRVHLFFVDERSVPPDDPQSNYAMINAVLISRVPLPRGQVHRIMAENHPVVAAAACRAELAETFTGEPPRFDVMTLGVGADGHTASLFPGTDALAEMSRPVQAVFVGLLRSWRVTMTRPSLDNARKLLVLVTGRAKADIVRRVLDAPGPDPELPASLIHPTNGELLWMLDAAAATLMDPARVDRA
jgi:6-phosphogluconolactonase